MFEYGSVLIEIIHIYYEDFGIREKIIIRIV